jgi:polyribonucleotide nucleotidyltransferase
MIPPESVFPYTLRIVSDILESNGSSVHGHGVRRQPGADGRRREDQVAPVAGVAMGLVKEATSHAILTDIAGAEDHYGDMDFKVAGTRAGITALQMDIKVQNISLQIMREALEQARRARLFILDKMDEVLATPRAELSPYAPRIYTITVPTEKNPRDHRAGWQGHPRHHRPDGRQDRRRRRRHGERYSPDDGAASRALKMISEIAAVAEVGKTYLGKVVRIADFGAFVEIFPGTDGLLHISEISENRVKNVRDELARAIRSWSKCSPSRATRSSSAARRCCASSARNCSSSARTEAAPAQALMAASTPRM